ncbi:MAG: glycosyltransferase [Crocinitomicaceae bacterium]|nr:glycosyltransferase [Flavobacteriales bacterium]NQZ37986.1 glycosyltransferase [Crocinitomicaceae bacterium]
MSRKNIVHITLGKANPERQNGVNRVVYNLATSQAKEGHKVAVWGITKNPTVNFKRREFETILFLDERNKFELTIGLRRAIERAPRDTVFHLHGAFLPQLYSVSKHLVKNKHEYIYTPHGAFNGVAMKRSFFKKKIYSFFFEKFIVNHARFVQAIGHSEIKGTINMFGMDIRVELIPNGQKVKCIKLIDFIGKDESVQFGFVGRLDVQTKGLDLLIQGFSDFIANYEQTAKLHIVGDGPDKDKLISLIQRLNLVEHVEMHGALFGEKKDAVLESLHYLCLTSRNEGLPGVVLEALASSVPCIVSKETNMGDYIDQSNSGYCLKENTRQEISEILTRASEELRNISYIDKTRNARELVLSTFKWEEISNQLIQKFYAT